MSVKIIVDSTADMTPSVAAQVGIVSLTVRFGDKEYVSGVDIDSRTFYKMLAESDTLPTTSQPTPYAFEKAYKQAIAEGHDVVCITCSGKLSGTNQSANIAADDYEDRVYVVDSRTIALGLGILAEYALDLADRGLSAREIAQKIQEKRESVRLMAMVDTLEYLKKGGRLNAAVAAVGGLLNIKPIIALQDGEIKVVAKARGLRQAYTMLNQEIAKNGGIDEKKPILLGYTGQSDDQLKSYRESDPSLWPEICPSAIVGSVVGTHVGPGAAAVAFFCREDA